MSKKADEIRSTSQELMTQGADSLLEPFIDLAGDIPVVGTLFKLNTLRLQYRDYVFQRKLQEFLHPFSRLDAKERKKISREALKPEQWERFGTTLSILIDQAEDLEKPLVMGRLFASHVRGDIEHDDFLRLCKMVQRCYFEDLAQLGSFGSGPFPGRVEQAQSLTAIGFLVPKVIDGGTFDDEPDSEGGTHYELSSFGRQLVNYGLD